MPIIQKLVKRLGGRAAGRQDSLSSERQALARVSAFWAERAAETADCPALPGIWTAHPLVRAAMNRRISGRGDVEWLAWAKQTFFPEPVELALSLGCGGGHVEREALALGLCRSIEGVDVSEGAVELARQRAAEAGLREASYRVADINRIELPALGYDLVIAKQSLHHITELEHVLGQVNQALRAGGWFLLNEYVGPSRFQWSDAQVAIANELLAALPDRLRRVGGPHGELRCRIERPPLELLLAQDPSEAVRSAEIAPEVEGIFDVVERRDFGGTILNPMLEGIAPNFSPDSEPDTAILQLLIAVEEALLKLRVIPSDFTVLVTRKRP